MWGAVPPWAPTSNGWGDAQRRQIANSVLSTREIDTESVVPIKAVDTTNHVADGGRKNSALQSNLALSPGDIVRYPAACRRVPHNVPAPHAVRFRRRRARMRASAPRTVSRAGTRGGTRAVKRPQAILEHASPFFGTVLGKLGQAGVLWLLGSGASHGMNRAFRRCEGASRPPRAPRARRDLNPGRRPGQAARGRHKTVCKRFHGQPFPQPFHGFSGACISSTPPGLEARPQARAAQGGGAGAGE